MYERCPFTSNAANNPQNGTATAAASRRQSIAVIPSSQTTTQAPPPPPRRSTMMIMEDPRPITDRSYIKKCTTSLYKYLISNGYEHPVTMKSLHLPSSRDFQFIVTFLLRKFDPTFYADNKSKFEDEVSMAFKALGYPFNISKTGLVAAGSPHTWPALLAALSWLVELLQYDEIYESELQLQQQVEEGASGEEELDVERMILRSEKSFFKYLLQAYEMFLCGDDESYDKLEEGLVEMFEGDNGMLEMEKNRIMDDTVTMLEVMEDLNKYGSAIPELEKRRENYCDDLDKFRALEKQLIEHKATLEGKVTERQREKEQIESDLQSISLKLDHLWKIVEGQGITLEDVQRMQISKHEMEEQLDEINSEKMAYSKQVWETEMKLSKQFDHLSEIVQTYNRKTKELGLKDDFQLQLQRKYVLEGKEHVFHDDNKCVLDLWKELDNFREKLVQKTAEARLRIAEVLDEEETSEEVLVAKDEEIRALDAQLKSDLSLNRETQELHVALAAIDKQVEGIESKIKSVHDPLALQSELLQYKSDLAELEATRVRQIEDLTSYKGAIAAEIIKAIDIMTKTKQKKDMELQGLVRYMDDALLALEMIDSSIADELKQMESGQIES